MTETAFLQMPMHALAGLPLGGATPYISLVPAAKMRRAQMYDSDSDSN